MSTETTAASAPVTTGTPTVTFVENNVTCDAPAGMTLRKLATKHGVRIQTGTAGWANCHGLGLCGTCRVSADNAASVTPPTFFEKFTLGKDAGKLRLACQTKVTGPVNVKIKPALDYAEIHHNVVFQSALIGVFSLVMLGFLAMMFLDIAGIGF